MTMRHKAWYGCTPDFADHRDRRLTLAAPQVFAASYDLSAYLPPVMDQDALGSCTAHGTTAAARYCLIRSGQKDFAMSRLQLYYDSRDIEGSVAYDSGAQIRDVINTLAHKGCGHEDLWPYAIGEFAVQPPQEVYDDAKNYEALVYERVPVSRNGLLTALANGHPVVIGISVYDSFEDTGNDGVVKMPGDTEDVIGGHCMLVFGYGQKKGYFTVRNSWGALWGDKGNCYIPEQYLESTGYGSDYWIIDLFGGPKVKAYV